MMYKIKIGFTGSRYGMNAIQEDKLFNFLAKYYDDDVTGIHGDCIGSDEYFHSVCTTLSYFIEIHPPIEEKYRAFCKGATEVLKPLPYLERNKKIVDNSNILIATPGSFSEEWRSGTWSTIRYARKKKISVYIIELSGEIIKEEQNGQNQS